MVMLRSRLITAVLLGLAFVGALLGLSDVFWALFLLMFILVGAWEWGGLAGYTRKQNSLFVMATLAAALLLLPGISAVGAPLVAALLCSALVFWVLLAPAWLIHRWKMPGHFLAALLGWLVLLPPWIALLLLRHIGPGAVLGVMLVVIVADSAAYGFGKAWGRRKLAPAISPGKTWEGLLGALATVALLTTAVCVWRHWSLWFVVGSAALVVLSVIGDLFESLMKRHAGKKDSGTLLPGHGGVLDRIDGMVSTLPLAAFYAYLPWFAHTWSLA